MDLFPSGFPPELVSAALVSSNEVAWRPLLAARSVEWLGAHGYALLGTELWLQTGGSDYKRIPCLIAFPVYVLKVRQGLYRAFVEEGDVYVNVTWVSEAEFRNLKA
jgi:hypothetical protein